MVPVDYAIQHGSMVHSIIDVKRQSDFGVTNFGK